MTRARFARLCWFVPFSIVAACEAGVDERVPDASDSDTSTIQPAPDAGPMCRGNGDGVVSRDEVVFAPGVAVRYRINPAGTTVSVNVDGDMRPDGTRAWDFSDPNGDLVSYQLITTDGAWFASSFPTAQYAARIDPRAPELGVYRATNTALELLGVAGEDEASGTLVQYDNPVPLVRFPLVNGATWTADAMVVNGMVDHTPIASRDHYDVTVDAAGEVNVGVLTFRNTLRIRVESTQMFPAGPGMRHIQYLWMTECYGEVARITSTDGEVDPSFGTASEFRRIGF
jgi:hypothetical protein